MVLSFAALGMLPLPEATAIYYSGPIFVVLFAALLLNERILGYRLVSVLLGMVGVLTIVYPQFSLGRGDHFSYLNGSGATIALSAVVFTSIAQIYVRRLSATNSTSTIVLVFTLFTMAVSLVTSPFGWVVPSTSELILLALAGIAGGTSQMLLANAYRLADASLVAPFGYVSMPVSIAVGYWIFGEMLTFQMLSGAMLISLGGILLIARNGK